MNTRESAITVPVYDKRIKVGAILKHTRGHLGIVEDVGYEKVIVRWAWWKPNKDNIDGHRVDTDFYSHTFDWYEIPIHFKYDGHVDEATHTHKWTCECGETN